MKMRGNIALRLGIILGILVTAGLAVTVFLLVYTTSRDLTEQTARTALDFTNIVKEGVVRKLETNKHIEIVDDFSRITRETDIKSLFLFDETGHLVASAINGLPASMSNERGKYGDFISAENTSSIDLSTLSDSAWLIPSSDKEGRMRAVVRIDNPSEGKGLGYLVSDISPVPIRQAAGRMLFWAVISCSTVFILLMLCMAWLVQRTVHVRLKTLDENMGLFADGQLEVRVPSLGEDEIGRIAVGFNAMAQTLQEKVERLESLATTDYLTSLLNHRGFQERMKAEAHRAQRYCRSFSLILLDIDHFKRINDRHGYQAGDSILKQLAEEIQSNCRETDFVARYGGEEFAVILPETMGADAQILAEKLRSAVEVRSFSLPESLDPVQITISLGVACFPNDSTKAEGLLMAVELALLRAKSISRNVASSYSALARLGKIDDPYLLHRYLEEGTVESLVTLVEVLENRDPYICGHSRRVTELALEISRRMEISEEQQELLRLAGLLHDIGNIGIPAGILNKPSALTEAEWRFVRTHAPVGGSILNASGSLNELVPVVTHHHERYNGTGYPNGLKGNQIPFLARILAAADAVDAMRSPRPYRAAFTCEEIVEEVYRQSGEQFDPQVATALVEILRRKAKVAVS